MIARRTLMIGAAAAGLASGRAFAAKAELAGAVEAAAGSFLAANPQAAGVSIGLLRGEDRHDAHFGKVVRGGTAKPDARTIYPIASISKTFAAALLARATVEGRAGLDDDIRLHLDGDYPNLAFEGQPIRLWHLLNHNSGLPFALPDIPENRPPFPPVPPEVARRIRAYGRADFQRDLHAVTIASLPGSGFSYSNAAVTLLSHILERLYRRPFEALVKAEIAGPLGMRDTFVVPTPEQAKRAAPGYDEHGVPAPPIDDSLLGAGALRSTVADMLGYARWQMEERDPAVRLSHAPHPISGKFSVGLNWQMMIDGSRRRIWQEGSMPGYVSMCALLPHSRIALVAFANELDRASAPAFGRMTRQILTALDPGSSDLF
jgi:serine-type D-Ala-D-Ala carboxypeptidase/endopeptidase